MGWLWGVGGMVWCNNGMGVVKSFECVVDNGGGVVRGVVVGKDWGYWWVWCGESSE